MNSVQDKFNVTEDAFLGGAVRLRQPAKGFRSGSDAVFLAASVPARSGNRVLDVGCGVGAVALCLAARVDGALVDGIEVQPALAEMFTENITLNGWTDRMRGFEGDLSRAPKDMTRNAYDFVVSNPPYFDPAQSRLAADPSKATAHAETTLGLKDWVRRCLGFTRPGGALCMIYRAERLDDLLAALAGRAGDVHVFPLWPEVDRPAKLILVRATKEAKAPLKVLPGLVVHDGPESHSAQSREILRSGAALLF